jgi:hypothetical protein
MPQLSNTQHESYARNRAAGFNRTQAAIRSEYNTVAPHNAGSRIEKRPEIQARIQELKEKSDGSKRCSREWVESELIHTIKISKKDKQYAVTRACLELIARIEGYLNPNETAPKTHLHVHAIDRDSLNALLARSVSDLPPAERQALMLEAPEELRNVIETACEDVTPVNIERQSNEQDAGV